MSRTSRQNLRTVSDFDDLRIRYINLNWRFGEQAGPNSEGMRLAGLPGLHCSTTMMSGCRITWPRWGELLDLQGALTNECRSCLSLLLPLLYS